MNAKLVMQQLIDTFNKGGVPFSDTHNVDIDASSDDDEYWTRDYAIGNFDICAYEEEYFDNDNFIEDLKKYIGEQFGLGKKGSTLRLYREKYDDKSKRFVKPKFKVGERVLHMENRHGHALHVTVYRVKKPIPKLTLKAPKKKVMAKKKPAKKKK